MNALPFHRAGSVGPLSIASPQVLSGLIGWWDADDLSTITQAGGVTSQWNDKSGQGNHLIQGTGAAQPAVISSGRNGRAVLRFDGSNDLMTTSGAIGGSGVTVIFVGKSTKSAGNVRIICGTGRGSPQTNGGFDLTHDDRSSNPTAGNSLGFTVNTGTTGSDTDKFRYVGKNNGYTDAWVMAAAGYAAADHQLWYNALDQAPYNNYFSGAGVNPHSASSLPFVLGALANGTLAAALDVGEVAIYSRRLNSGEIQLLFSAWFLPRWAL